MSFLSSKYQVQQNRFSPPEQNRFKMQPGNALATTGLPDGYATGLEDFGADDLKLPRLSINHENGTFKDNLSNMEFPVLEVIPLGAVKQRVLWKPSVDENKDAVPLCKSTDFQTGYPTVTQPNQNDNFPWPAVGWNPGDFQPNAEGRIVLPCASCRLKEWGSHPIDGKKTWCGEQHAIPLLYGPEGSEPGMTALFTAQRSSINASKVFFASIMRRQLPAFAVRARLILSPQTRGKNKYYVPSFVEIGLTDQANWPVYSDSLRSIREFISQPPRLKDDNNNGGQPVNTQNLGQQNVIQGQFTNNTWAPGQPAPQAPPQYQQPPVQQYAPPVQQYAPPAPPVQQYAPPAPPVQQYVPPAPPVPAAPPVQAPPVAQMPPAPPVVSAPPVAPPAAPPAPAPSTARDSDDDLPF